MNFEAEWARCAQWLQDALDHAGNTHDLSHVKAMVEAREARFWAGREAAMVTQVIDHPNFSDLLLWLAGGDRTELETKMRPAAEAWGRDKGCERSVIMGRPGWARSLRGEGYRMAGCIITKELKA